MFREISDISDKYILSSTDFSENNRYVQGWQICWLFSIFLLRGPASPTWPKVDPFLWGGPSLLSGTRYCLPSNMVPRHLSYFHSSYLWLPSRVGPNIFHQVNSQLLLSKLNLPWSFHLAISLLIPPYNVWGKDNLTGMKNMWPGEVIIQKC